MQTLIKSDTCIDVTYPYRNIQITNKNRGNGSLTADNDPNTKILAPLGFGMPTNPGESDVHINRWTGRGFHDW